MTCYLRPFDLTLITFGHLLDGGGGVNVVDHFRYSGSFCCGGGVFPLGRVRFRKRRMGIPTGPSTRLHKVCNSCVRVPPRRTHPGRFGGMSFFS